ncbi:hypothetical protein AB0K48_38325, partial [Nonomuraea sp. NPDC055795]
MAGLLLAVLLAAPARPAAADGGTLLESRPMAVPAELAAAGATGFRIRYASTSPKGRRIEVTGAVFLPSGTAPPGGRRVVSWAHGTTGVSDRCNPSRDRELGGYGYPGYLAGFVRRGYAVERDGDGTEPERNPGDDVEQRCR